MLKEYLKQGELEADRAYTMARKATRAAMLLEEDAKNAYWKAVKRVDMCNAQTINYDDKEMSN